MTNWIFFILWEAEKNKDPELKINCTMFFVNNTEK